MAVVVIQDFEATPEEYDQVVIYGGQHVWPRRKGEVQS